MQTNQQIIEVTGSPAQVWGNLFIPARGAMSIKIYGDTLYRTAKTGLEKKESWTRIQNIDSVEIHQSPIYALIGLGVFFFFMGLGWLRSSPISAIFLLGGVAIIVYTFYNKRRYLAIHSHRNTIVIFISKPPEVYQQFAMNVLALARKLNMSVNPSTKPLVTS
jgi:hypothetical protein